MQHTQTVLAQLNLYAPDVATPFTSYGLHNRLVSSYSRKDDEVVVREDLQGLPRATVADCVRVAKNSRFRCYPMHKRLVHQETVDGDNHTWFVFRLMDRDTVTQ